MSRIRIFDTTLRDGEQAPGMSMTRNDKVRMARQLDALGVDVIEAGFPASSPEDLAAVRTVAADVRRPIIAALARAAKGDIEAAARALEPAERPRIHTFIATSDIHLRKKLRISDGECLSLVDEAIRTARRYADDVEFSAEDATRTDPAFLCRVMECAIAAGATTINVPDTVGYTYPSEYRRLLETLRAGVEGIEKAIVSVHCHDDLGLAVANSLVAVEAGAGQVECTVNGVGERAGNAALEEIAMALRVRQDLLPYETAIETTEIYRTSQLLSRLTGAHPQANKAVVGKNAFAHEAGIHQDGVLKDRTTYEIMTPEMLGIPGNRLVLGKHSGRRALVHRYRQLGYELDGDRLDKAYRLFCMLADQKREILDEDLLSILFHGAMDDAPERFRLRAIKVVSGGATARATITLDRPEFGARTESADGDGPIAATFAAIDRISEIRTRLQDLTIRAATPGRDAVGEVDLSAAVDGRTVSGHGASTDVVEAAARAYLNALNRGLEARQMEARALEEASYLWGV